MRNARGVVAGAAVAVVAAGLCGWAWAEDAATRPGAALPFTLSKETTVLVSPLKADGTPDYVAAVNARYGKGVTKENNAFVAWLKIAGTGPEMMAPEIKARLLEMCGAEDWPGLPWQMYSSYVRGQGASDQEQAKCADDDMKGTMGPWKQEEYPRLAAYLKWEGDYLDGVRSAFERPRFWAPMVAVKDDSMMNALASPGLGRLRAVANNLCGRAMLRAGNRDFKGFLADAMAAKRMGRLLSSEPTLIERLVGVAINGVADRAIAGAAGRGLFTVEECGELTKALEALPPMPDMVEAMDVSERWIALDSTIVVALKGELRADQGELLAGGGIDRQAVDWDAVLKGMNAEMDQVVAASKKKSLDEMEAAWKQIDEKRSNLNTLMNLSKREGETREAYTQRVADSLGASLVPMFNRAAEMWRETVMQDEMLNMVIAGGRYRAETGAWARRASDLVPTDLKEIPKDIYSEHGAADVEYSWSGSGVVVRSIGRKYGVKGDERRRAVELGAK